MVDTKGEVPWPQERLKKFARGDLTLAELEGVDGDSQKKLAELGYRLLESGKLDDARRIFEGLVALNPKEPYFLLAVGAAAQREERFEDAERWYSKALERDDHNPIAWANRGEVRVMLANIEGATDDLIQAVKLDPKGATPQTKRAAGLLSEIRRQLEEARQGGKQ